MFILHIVITSVRLLWWILSTIVGYCTRPVAVWIAHTGLTSRQHRALRRLHAVHTFLHQLSPTPYDDFLVLHGEVTSRGYVLRLYRLIRLLRRCLDQCDVRDIPAWRSRVVRTGWLSGAIAGAWWEFSRSGMQLLAFTMLSVKQWQAIRKLRQARQVIKQLAFRARSRHQQRDVLHRRVKEARSRFAARLRRRCQRLGLSIWCAELFCAD